MSAWCEAHGFPPIETVRHTYKSEKYTTLEAECLGSATFPSLAYGFKKCSLKWKVAPQEKWAKSWQPALDAWARGERVEKAIGYHAGETHRSVKSESDQYAYRYLLREWGWSQRECAAAIKRAGLDGAAKSACFFCPSTKPHEILELGREHPDLLHRALTIERLGMTTLHEHSAIRGLGRNFRWADVVDVDTRQCVLALETAVPCGCYDGGDEDDDD